ncbi:MAG: glycosyltransferase family 4 protein [Ornithinimicrobium sp.]
MSAVLLVTGMVQGGVGAHVADLAAGLRRAGWQVSVAAPSAVIERFALVEEKTPARHLQVGSRPSPIFDARAVAALRAQMRRVDVVHAHGLRAGALAVLARSSLVPYPRSRRAARQSPALVVTSHNAAPAGLLSRQIYAALEQIVVRGADDLLVVSPDLHSARSRSRRPPAQRAVVAAIKAVPTADREAGRRMLGAGAGESVVLSVGRLAPQKAMHRVVDVVSALAATGHPVRGVIVGEGPERQGLQQHIDVAQAPVTLLGQRADVPDLLAAADVVLSSAIWEGQPVWLQEALALGTAIVATDVGGSRAMIGDGAEWVEGEPTAGADDAVVSRLSTAVSALLDDPQALADLRARARRVGVHLPTSQDATAAALESYRRAASYHRRPHVD